MNDDTDKPLNPVGDDALEARLTAWVLGEASPFEAAELESLCARDPQARLFERRLRVLHGFISADTTAGPEEAWKLSAEKRAKIEELFAEAVPAPPPVVEAPVKSRWVAGSGRRALLALAACTVVGFVSWVVFQPARKGGMPMMVLHKSASAEAPAPTTALGGRERFSMTGEPLSRALEVDSPIAASPAPTPVPVPEISEFASRLGDGQDFGEGWGSRGQDTPGSLSVAEPEALAKREADFVADAPVAGMIQDKTAPPPAAKPAEASADIAAVQRFRRQAERGSAPEEVPARGLRSGDSAITRAEIDAVLNSPDRAKPAANGVRSLTGTFTEEQVDGLLKDPSTAVPADDEVAAATALLDTPPAGNVELRYADGNPVPAQGPTTTFGRELQPMAQAKQSDSLLAEPVEGGTREDLSRWFGTLPQEEAAEKSQPPVSDLDGFVNRGTPLGGAEPTDSKKWDDPIRINPALAYENTEHVDEVRRKLYTAEGSLNLGKHDEAHQAYEEALRIDPYNKAARRGMEQVAQARADYYRAAYDQTRAELLAQVDSAWELSVPPVDEAKDAEATGAPGELLTRSRGFNEADDSDSAGKAGVLLAKEKAELEAQLQVLSQVNGVALHQYAAGLSVPDNVIPILLPQVAEQKRILQAKLGEGLGADHPDVVAQRQVLDGLERDLNEATTNLKETLQAKLSLADEQIARLIPKLTPEDRDEISRLLPTPPPAPEPLPEPAAEVATAAEPFSTFSLHVSDASFKLAKAALERGEVPAAESIRPEEFYNAFDYGDPAPSQGEPVACAVEQSAHPVIPQRNLLRIGVKTGSQGRGGSTPLNLTLLLDSSGSMEREDRQLGLANAVRQLSGLLKEGDTISVIGFSRQPRLLVDRLPGSRAQELNAIFAQTPAEGGTNLEEGLRIAEELALRQFQPAAQNRVVLFTDGAANLGDAEPETLQGRVEQMRQKGIAFDAAGFGTEGLNDRLLERLTRNGDGRYYVVDRAEDADANFARQLAGAFRPAAENVKVQVHFNPARVARYKLIGFEEHRLKKEDFRNDAVDAAEMAAEEAGNALYQIEVLPRGEGEVGEVSVRFRDAASGQMVERTWTIPYDPQAPAFDQAKPSLQLAGLAAFAAEKLRSTPLAASLDFQQLAPVMAAVKARYPGSAAVVELESMIGKLR